MKNQKKTELPLKEFLESEAYAVLNREMNTKLNVNNITFNSATYNSNITNQINFDERRKTFTKTPDEIELLRVLKMDFKSKSFIKINENKKQKELFINSIINSNPKFNIKVIIT